VDLLIWGKSQIMLAYYCDTFVLPLPAKHRFPMAKYERLREAIMDDSELSCHVELKLPPAACDDELLLVHDRDYLDSLIQGTLDPKLERRIGFPYSPGLLERSRRSVGATLAACRAALEDSIAVNLAGGTHHAFREGGEGFCVFNDTVVALKTLQREKALGRAIVIDTDVHQGNGTAKLLADDPSVFTFSIHGAKNFPFRKETSDLDVALPDGTNDRDYLEALSRSLAQMQNVDADMVIFQSGADPFELDKLGRLSLTAQGLKERDVMVLDWCANRKLPVAVTMGGGYAPDVDDIVNIHLETVRQSLRHFVRGSYSRSRRASSSF
jgi:acetoin utilization deacetylase AcuC-like enzyme